MLSFFFAGPFGLCGGAYDSSIDRETLLRCFPAVFDDISRQNHSEGVLTIATRPSNQFPGPTIGYLEPKGTETYPLEPKGSDPHPPTPRGGQGLLADDPNGGFLLSPEPHRAFSPILSPVLDVSRPVRLRRTIFCGQTLQNQWRIDKTDH